MQPAVIAQPPGRILVADDEPQNIQLLARLMRRLGHDVVTASNGQLALDAVRDHRPDVVLLDVNMPELDGFEVCRSIKNSESTRLVPVVLITGLGGAEDRVRGIDAGADDFLTKPFGTAELSARVRSLMRLKRHTDGMDSAAAVVLSLGLTIEARDPYTRGHCERLADYATALGRRVGLSEIECDALYRGGFLHDVGKIGIPDAVLLKAGSLASLEYAVMQQHTLIGDRLCSELRSLEDVRPIVRHHHERYDGTGYPDGLKGEDIPYSAQIVGLVDAYDAMTTVRPYKAALTPEQAFAELRAEIQRGWRSAPLVETFIEMLRERDGVPSPLL